MKELGGYIELDTYKYPMLHDKAVALNCGRNALAYLFESKNISRIYLPAFLCSSVENICKKYKVDIIYYHIDINFRPIISIRRSDEWLYLVNYYGQITTDILKTVRETWKNVIVDNAQAYFAEPLEGVDTIYTCRKYFGVPDGAFLYTDSKIRRDLPVDESFERMHFLLGRFERTASEFYQEYLNNNHLFANEPIKEMSKLTDNLLRGINYSEIEKQRTNNFSILHNSFAKINKLKLHIPKGAFMYPLYIDDGNNIRRELQQKKIYIPILLPDVRKSNHASKLEIGMAENILPLPCDQRYGEDDLLYMVEVLKKCIS